MAKLQEKKFFKVIILIVVFCIPIIYSFFYLKSYWDPYGKLENMDVAIVNLDKGKDGENKGKELVDKLVDKNVLKLSTVTEEEASEGLSNQQYYATITIPENFTENLESAKEENKKTATITYRPNQKLNYLASQIINKVVTAAQTEIQTEVSKEVVATLSDNLREVPDSLGKISDGANEIYDGSTSLRDGLKAIKEGTETLDDKYSMFDDGIKTAYKGSNTLAQGTAKVNSGVKDLSRGGKTLEGAIAQINSGVDTLMASGTEGITKLATGVTKVDNGATDLKTGVNNYVAGTDNLTANVSAYTTKVNELNSNTKALLQALAAQADSETADETTKKLANKAKQILKEDENGKDSFEKIKYNGTKINAGAQNLISNDEKLTKGVEELKAGTSQLASGTSSLGALTNGITTLKAGLNQVENGTKNLNSGIDTLKSGTQSLEQGANSLRTGLETLSTSSDTVKEGIQTLAEGSKTAYDGSKELSRGTLTFKSEISKGLDEANDQIDKLDNLDTHVENAVEVNEEDYGEVSSYGIAFTPLFLSIGLWVGALMCYVILYYDQRKRFGILGNHTKNKLLQNAIYIGIAVGTGLLTGFLLKAGLGLETPSTFVYYLECALISVTYMSIIQFLIKNFGDIGKFLALIILILQLASSGGTFPVPLIDKGFQAISPFLPMTYSIKIVKDCLIQTDTNFILQNSMILIGITVVCFIITTITDIIKMKKAKEQ